MIWIYLLAIVVIFLIFQAKKETKILEKEPFNEKYHILIMGFNLALFKGEAIFETKDAREHYLFKNLLSKQSYLQLIYRKNTLYLKYYEDFMDFKTEFSYYYSGVEDISVDKQKFIVDDFCSGIKRDGKVTY